MNKFVIFSCVEIESKDEDGYDGPVIVLACSSDQTFMLFFPVTEANAEVLGSVIGEQEDEEEIDVDTSVLGIYKTMLDSWEAGNRYLSGIIMDTIYSEQAKKEIPMIRLVLSDQNGIIDSFVPVNFIHAILLAAMEKLEIIVTDRLLEIMLPASQDENRENIITKKNHPEFLEDKGIVDIARKIMEGKINDDDDSENSNGDIDKSNAKK